MLTVSKGILLLGGILTAIGTFCSFYYSHVIKNSPPDLAIKNIFPVMIYQTREVNFEPKKKIKFMDKGISFVIHVKSKTLPVTVNRLKIKGKIYIPFNLYMAQDINAGRNINEIYKEYEERKPYILVDWTAYVDEGKSKNQLSAFDDKLISFTLIDPIANGQPESGWRVPLVAASRSTSTRRVTSWRSSV